MPYPTEKLMRFAVGGVWWKGCGGSIPRRRRLSLSENGNPFVRFADISPNRGISHCHFVTSPQRGAPCPTHYPDHLTIGVLFIIHFSIFSLQFSVYLANEIYWKGCGTSQASYPTEVFHLHRIWMGYIGSVTGGASPSPTVDAPSFGNSSLLTLTSQHLVVKKTVRHNSLYCSQKV